MVLFLPGVALVQSAHALSTLQVYADRAMVVARVPEREERTRPCEAQHRISTTGDSWAQTHNTSTVRHPHRERIQRAGSILRVSAICGRVGTRL